MPFVPSHVNLKLLLSFAVLVVMALNLIKSENDGSKLFKVFWIDHLPPLPLLSFLCERQCARGLLLFACFVFFLHFQFAIAIAIEYIL